MPKQVEFMYDGVDKSLLYRAVRESRDIAENLMSELYPGPSLPLPPSPALVYLYYPVDLVLCVHIQPLSLPVSGWSWNKQTKHWSEHDQRKCVRKPEDVTIEQVLSIFFTDESFTTPLWNMIRGRTASVQVEEQDIIAFLKVFCCLMFYKCTIREFFHDPDDMYKKFPMGEGMSEKKFRAIINSFKSVHDRRAR